MPTENVLLTRLVATDEGTTKSMKDAKAAIIDFRKAAEKAGKSLEDSFKGSEEQAKKTEKATKSLGAGLSGLKSAYAGVAAAVTASVAALGVATKVAAEYQAEIKRLEVNLGLMGVSSAAVTKALVDQASGLQRVTKFSDSAIISVQSLLTSMGVAPNQLKQATEVVLDVAAATGKSLETVAQQSAKTVGGFAGELGELIPEIKDLTKAQLQAGGAFEILGRRFGGAARAEVETYAGAWAQMTNSLGDVVKQIGLIVTNTPAATKAIRDLAEGFNILAEQIAEAFSSDGMTQELRALNAQRDALLRTEEELVRLRDSRQNTGFFTGEKMGGLVPGLTDPAGIEQKITDAREKGRDIARQIRELEEKIAEEKAKQTAEGEKALELAGKQKDLLNEEAERREKLEKLRPDFEKLEEELTKDTENRLEAIEREYQERVKVINAVADLDEAVAMKREKLLDQARDARIRKEVEAAKEIAEKEAKAQADAAAERLRPVAAVQGAVQDPLSAIGGIFGGGGVGALIGSTLPGMIAQIAAGLPQIFSQIGDSIKGAVEGVGGFFKSIGSFFGGLFGGRGYAESFGQAIADVIDRSELVTAIQELTDALGATVDQFRTTGDLLARSQGRLERVGRGQAPAIENLLDVFDAMGPPETSVSYENGRRVERVTRARGSLRDLLDQGYSLDELTFRASSGEDFQAALDELGAALQEEADAIVEVANLRIRTIEEETAALIAQKEEALKPIQDEIRELTAEINRLKGARDAVESAFGSAIEAVSGALTSPAETVASLQARFDAATGEEKAQLGTQLAGALQAQFQSAQQMAAQGLISGEELARIQADILGQLEMAQEESLSEFDQLISIAEDQLAESQRQEQEILDEMEAIRTTAEEKIEELKAEAIAQVEKLEEILEAVKAGNINLLLERIQEGQLDTARAMAEILRGMGIPIPQFAEGTPYVPRTGLAVLHQGERVIPAGQNMPSVTVNINGMPATGRDRETIARTVREILLTNQANIRGIIREGR